MFPFINTTSSKYPLYDGYRSHREYVRLLDKLKHLQPHTAG